MTNGTYVAGGGSPQEALYARIGCFTVGNFRTSENVLSQFLYEDLLNVDL
jgi:hypothetical protein